MGDEEVKTLNRGNSPRSFVIKGSRQMSRSLEGNMESRENFRKMQFLEVL